MLNLIRADLYKLRKSAVMKVLFILMCLSAAAVTIISYMIAAGEVGTEISGTASLFADAAMMSIIGSIIAGIYICGDFENKTINSAILSGSSRWAILLSKVLVYFLIAAVMLFPYILSSALGLASGYEFSKPFVPSVFLDLLANETGHTFNALIIMQLFAIYVTMAVVYAAQLSIGVLLAFLLKNKPVLVVGINVVLSMLCAQLMLLKDSIPVVGGLLSYLPFAFGFPDITLSAGAGLHMKAILFSLIFIALMLGITYKIFKKAELK